MNFCNMYQFQVIFFKNFAFSPLKKRILFKKFLASEPSCKKAKNYFQICKAWWDIPG